MNRGIVYGFLVGVILPLAVLFLIRPSNSLWFKISFPALPLLGDLVGLEQINPVFDIVELIVINGILFAAFGHGIGRLISKQRIL
jgi:hypothetical protein